MSSSLFNGNPVLHATWLYYQGDENQAKVATIMGMSHVTTVKYLQAARENGLIHINLGVSVFSSIDAASQTRDKLNLQRVIIVPDDEHTKRRSDTKLVQTRLSCADGMYLNQVIENNDVPRAAWGRTAHQMSKAMAPEPYKNVTVIRMFGSMPSQPDLAIIESSSQIAYKFSDRVTSLYMPAMVSSVRLATELQAGPAI